MNLNTYCINSLLLITEISKFVLCINNILTKIAPFDQHYYKTKEIIQDVFRRPLRVTKGLESRMPAVVTDLVRHVQNKKKKKKLK